ncbi:Abscisic acid 8-hydroxylase 4 [Striga hermonthica]|uniref:Abscisic acid 8-hydroxylase 4 n=1 Tax=Striga hermonthica TaxID=68872 RepID=A0A9N7ML20_STRHE|nr:Abscisic acid 8-hydroxylase 4 [Striga hermonthica]
MSIIIFPTTFIYILLFLTTLIYYVISRNSNRKHKRAAKLPPGSMGWPYLGETLQLYRNDPNIFFSEKLQRYGEIFKTRILGCPCVMLASPEAAKFVLVNNAGMFRPTYPRSKERMIGPWALFFHQGDYHSFVRKLVQSPLSPEAIKRLIPEIEAIADFVMESLTCGKIVNTFQGMKRVILESLRLASIVSFTFREAVVDVEYNGYLIPKGWKAAQKPNTYMPFGTGSHSCPGNELARLEMLIFIHHLVNKLRWEVVGSKGTIEYSPFPVPHKGLRARFWIEPDNQ